MNKFFHEQYRPQLEPLNEIYFGRPSAFKKVEDLFDKWIAEAWKAKDLPTNIRLQEAHKYLSEAIKKDRTILEKILMNTFGFTNVTVQLLSDITKFNMSTSPNLKITTFQLNSAGKKLDKAIRHKWVDLQNKYMSNPHLSKKEQEANKAKMYSEMQAFINDINGNPLLNQTRNLVELQFRDKVIGLNNIDYLLCSKNGIRFNTKLLDVRTTINLYLRSFTRKGITGEILTGALLHEIGHNFYRFIIAPTLQASTQLTLTPSNIITQGEEMFSDQFVTMYGYGLANIKFGSIALGLKGMAQRIENDELGYFNTMIGSDIISDPHPMEKIRADNMINQMKEDLKDRDKILTDEKKQELRDELARTRKYLRKTYKINHNDDENIQKAKIMRRITAQYAYNDMNRLDDTLIDDMSKSRRHPINRKMVAPRIVNKSVLRFMSPDEFEEFEKTPPMLRRVPVYNPDPNVYI